MFGVVLLLVLAGRPDTPGDGLFSFDAGDTVLVFDSARFRFHYAVAGTNSVPVADTDGSGVPDHVEDLADIYEDALDRYVELGFRAPLSDEDLNDNGGDGRFDVYLVDFNRAADGAFSADVCDDDRCIGHMVQENDFRGYGYPSARVGNKTVGSHELFHAVQAAYDVDQGAVFAEGTAVWASERFDASLDDLENFSSGYLDDAESPLDTTSANPVDPFSYGTSLFWLFLSESFGDELLVKLWERVDDTNAENGSNPFWLDVIDEVLVAEEGVGFSSVFSDFAVACALTGERARPGLGFRDGDEYAERAPEEQTFPIDQGRFVVFTSSSRLLRAVPRGRGEIQAALRDSPVDGVDGLDDRADMGLALVAIDLASGDVRVEEAVGDDTLRAAIDVGPDDDVYLVVDNGRREGQGSRPILCAGDGEEVDACLLANGGEGEGEGEEGEGEGETPTLSGGGCHCAGGGAATSWISGAGIGLLALRRRRGQRCA